MTAHLVQFDLFKTPLTDLKGKNLIEASAGTGKTFCIENIYVRYLLEKEGENEDISINEILVVTFTNAATKELKSRINNRIEQTYSYLNSNKKRENDAFYDYLDKIKGDEEKKEKSIKSIKRALSDFDKANIFTIHSFCERVLTENAFESSNAFTREVSHDETKYIDIAVEDFWRKYVFTLPAEVYDKLKEVEEDKTVKSQKLDLDVFKAIANSAVKVMKPTIIPSIKNYKDVEGLLITIKEIKKTKACLKNIYEKEKENIEAALKKNLDSPMSYRLSNSLEEYFYDNDVLIFDKSGLVDLPNVHNIFKEIKNLNNAANNLLGRIDATFLIYLRVKLCEFADERIKYLKSKAKKITFSNQLKDLYDALCSASDNKEFLLKKIKERYKIAMIDEFQDTDKIQYEILKKIFFDEDKTIFLIGDPKQSIYKFRGADIYAYLKAKNEYGIKKFPLYKNYRSSKKLLNGFNTIFGSLKNPFVVKGIDYTSITSGTVKFETEGLDENIEIKYCDEDINNADKAENAVCNNIVNEISKLLDKKNSAMINDRPLKANDIAIIVPKNKNMELLRRHLNKYQIPVVASSHESVFATEEAKEIKKFLVAISNPANGLAVRTALATSFFDKSAVDIYELRHDEKKSADLTNEFAAYQEAWQNQGFYAMMMKFIAEKEIKKRFIKKPGGSRKLVNLLHLTELIHKASKIGINGIYETIKWIDDKENDTDNPTDEYLLRLESDEESVNIITVHKSKGLEFPIVFFPFFWDEVVKSSNTKDVVVFHKDNDDKIYLDVGSENIEVGKQKRALESLAEDVRLFYVAITRAACKCYIYYYYNAGGAHKNRSSAMNYLFHYANKNIDEIDDAVEIRNFLKDKKNKLQKYSDRIDDLRKIANSSDDSIVLSKIENKAPESLTLEERGKTDLVWSGDFTGTIKTAYSIESYSHLSSQMQYDNETNEADEFYDAEKLVDNKIAVASKETINDGIFYFEKGAKAGSDFHKIMENLDFASAKTAIEKFVKSELSGLYSDSNLETLSGTVYDVLNIDLGSFFGKHFCLKDIEKNKKYAEMEFYLHLNNLQSLKDVLMAYFKKKDLTEFVKSLERLSFSEIETYLHGFIDLVFCHKNKYYIIDWKFNHLGYEYNNYRREELLKTISNANYYLQYYIYFFSLYRYLKYKNRNFTMDDIGGVFYIFARGIQKNKNTGIYEDTGIYFDRPIEFLQEVSAVI